MGSYYCNYFHTLEHATLAAACDLGPKRLATAATTWQAAQRFEKYQDLLASGLVDTVLIATPHYSHPDITIAALEKNLHVLCEKPAAVTVKQARRMSEAAAKHPHLKFGLNFQMRTNPAL